MLDGIRETPGNEAGCGEDADVSFLRWFCEVFLVRSADDGKPEGPARADQQREVDTQDHVRDENGGREQAEAGAESQAEAARPYAERMQRMLAALASTSKGSPTAPQMLVGTGRDQVHLLVVVTADRGLAGGFNTNVGRAARTAIQRLEGQGKTVKVIAVGRKGRDYLKREYASRLIGDFSFAGKKRVEFSDVTEIGERVASMLSAK